MVEFGRADDSDLATWSNRRRATKQRKYAALRERLAAIFALPVHECTLILGIRFSLVESDWTSALSEAFSLTPAAVTAIQRQAVSGAVLAAYGVWLVRLSLQAEHDHTVVPTVDAPVGIRPGVGAASFEDVIDYEASPAEELSEYELRCRNNVARNE